MRCVQALIAFLFVAALGACGSDDGEVAIKVAGTGSANGSGTVVGPNGLISCHVTTSGRSGTCSATVESGTEILLTATPDEGSLFTGWSGSCSGTGTCAFTASTSAEITAAFSRNIGISLERYPGSTGTVVVTSSPAGIACALTNGNPSGDCTALFPDGTNVTLSASVDADNLFDGWTGDCSGATCSIVIHSIHHVAPMTRSNYQVTVGGYAYGTGKGTIRSTPAGIECTLDGTETAGACSHRFPGASSVALAIVPDASAFFYEWDIPSCGSLSTCNVPLIPSTQVRASLARLVTLAVTTVPGSIGVADIFSGYEEGPLSCTVGTGVTTSCSARFPLGSEVYISASPHLGSMVAGWGECVGMGACLVQLSQDTTISVWLQPWKALQFNGTSQFATLEPVPAFDNAASWTVEAVVKVPEVPVGRQVIFSRWSGSAAALALMLNDGHLLLEVRDATGADQALEATGADGVITPGGWVRVAATYSNGSARLYVFPDMDALQVAEGPLPQASSQAALLSIGRRGPAGPGEYFHGQVDEVRSWNFALGQQALSDNAIGVYAPVLGLVGFWRLDEPDGQRLIDLSYAGGPGHDGVLGAMAEVEAADPVRTEVTGGALVRRGTVGRPVKR